MLPYRVDGVFCIFLGQDIEPHPFTDVCMDGRDCAVKSMAVSWKNILKDGTVF